MLKYGTLLLLLFVFLSCSDNTVTIIKDPGTITGTILPTGISAQASINQGDFSKSVMVDNLGQFILTDIDPGVYTFVAKADQFGRFKEENIKIEDGEGYEIGLIELDTIPYPLYSISNLYFNYRDRINKIKFSISFNKFMDINSLEEHLLIDPAVENFNISTTSNIASSRSYYYCEGDYVSGIEYTITLDTNIKTFWGESLEFPFTQIVKYSSDEEIFQITQIDTQRIIGGTSDLAIYFNNNVVENYENFVNIEPYIPFLTVASGRRIIYRPVNSWVPDTEYSLSIGKKITDYEGNELGKDTTIVFTCPSMEIINHFPRNDQILLEEISSFYIDFNFMIDSTSVSESSIIIEPEAELTFELLPSYTRPILFVYTNGLKDNTKYTVTIKSNIRDYWGNNFKKPYSFSFQTKK